LPSFPHPLPLSLFLSQREISSCSTCQHQVLSVFIILIFVCSISL
jgi:hypothetical protein